MAGVRRVGPWTLGDLLGKGGNAEVYRATHDDGREAALKIIKAVKVENEPYQRFVREIGTLRGLSDMTGILPVIDAYLPERPTSADRPWLAMPVATTLDKALHDQPLEAVVTSIATVAVTLARLHAEGIGHRDVKPSNLYELSGERLVGDFGLVATPDTKGLTEDGRPLGSRHYTPYEMIANPATADPRPADVYALAKTLWVFATGKDFPLEGHQPKNTRGYTIAELRPHRNAAALDDLIDRCTKLHPEDRPTMAQVAEDLRRWLALPDEANAPDIAATRARVREKLASRAADQATKDQRRDLALDVVRRLTEMVAPINRAIRDLDATATIDGSADEFTRNLVKTIESLGTPEIVFRHQRLSMIVVGDRGREFRFRFARAVELEETGDLLIHFAITVGTDYMGGLTFHWMPDAWSAPVGSVEVEEEMRSAVAEATAKFEEAAAAFADGLPD